jgi:hypothetical protein
MNIDLNDFDLLGYFFLINVGVRVKLRASQLILRVLKLTTM